MAHYYSQGSPAHGRRSRRGCRARRPGLGDADRDAPIGQVALISTHPTRDPPTERPRAALPRRARRTRRHRSTGARRPLRHPRWRPSGDDRPAPRAGRGAHREWQPAAKSDINEAGDVLIEFDVTGQWRTFAGDDLAVSAPRLRAAHPPRAGRNRHAHVGRHGRLADEQGAAYVEASRARQGTDWYVSREDLGVEGHDTDRIKRLAQNMSRSHSSPVARAPRAARPRLQAGLHRSIAPSRASRIPGIAPPSSESPELDRTPEATR